jgi:mono/diheme cytochrome c family protein
MYNQPKYGPYEESTFFRDGAAARPLEPGVVSRQPGPTAESLDQTRPVATGRNGADYVAQNPLPVNEALIARGEDRFQIFCAPCHGTLGNGKGVTARYFNPPPASLYIARLKESPDGYLFDVITNGKGQMFSYASRIPVEDRWAIIAYIRQIQQNPPAGVQPQDLVETTPTPAAQQGSQQNNAQPTATP